MKADAIDKAKATGPRRGLRILAAAVYVGVTPSKFEEMVSDGRMPKPKRFDGVVVWDMRELDIYFEALPTGGEGPPRRQGFG